MDRLLSSYEFWHSPARQLLAYPSGDQNGLDLRWAELQTFGIEAIYDFGPIALCGLNILGAGYCGVVMRIRHQGQDRVLKIRREPSPQRSLQTEAEMLRRANSVNVGPGYIAHSDNFLLMHYLDGPTLVHWLQTSQSAATIYRTVSQLIHQAYRLDRMGLDHGDLRCVTAHALIQANGPALIDFGGASVNRRPANVTTLVQGLFISTQISKLLHPWFPQVNKLDLIKQLRRYKQQPCWVCLEQLLKYLDLPSTLVNEYDSHRAFVS